MYQESAVKEWKSVVQACQKLAKVFVAFGVVVGSCFKKIVYNKQTKPTVTYRPFVPPPPQNHSQNVPPYQFQRGGWRGPPPKSIPFQLISIQWGGSLLIESIFSGGEGGWRTLSFDISILSWPNQFSTRPYLCKQELQLCSSRARFPEFLSLTHLTFPFSAGVALRHRTWSGYCRLHPTPDVGLLEVFFLFLGSSMYENFSWNKIYIRKSKWIMGSTSK